MYFAWIIFAKIRFYDKTLLQQWWRLSHVTRAVIRWFFILVCLICFLKVARHPRGDSMIFHSCLLDLFFKSRHLVLDWGLLENPDLLVVVKDLRVKDWLWLEKVLAPLTHPTWSKLFYGLIWFENLKYWSNSKVLTNQLLNPRIYIETCSYIFTKNIT